MIRKSLFLMAVVFVLAGCSSGQKNVPADGGKKNTTANMEAGTDDGSSPVVISIAYENNPGEPLDVACNEWAKMIEEQSSGTMQVKVYPSSQLGSIVDIQDQALAGDAVIALGQNAMYADLGINEFDAPYCPFMFNNWDEVDKLIASDWWKEKEHQLEDVGLVVLSSGWRYGKRDILSKKPIQTVEDLKGLKIRVNPTTSQLKGFEALGASPIAMAMSDVYTSLQQGTIDAVEGSAEIFYNGKYYEVAKNMCSTGHVFITASWTCNKDFFNSLSEEHQKILLETGSEITQVFNELQAVSSDEAIEKLEEEGVQMSQIDREAFAESCQTRFFEYPEFSSWSPELKETLFSIIH